MEVAFDAHSVGSAIANASKSLQSRDAVIRYFQDKYPGQKTLKNGQVRYEWKTKIVDARMALDPDAKRASVNRQFQNDKKTGKMRYESSKPSPAEKARYKDLSNMLAKEYYIRGTLCVRYSPGMCESRKLDLRVGGNNAKGLNDNPSMQTIFNIYQFGKAQPDTMALTKAGGGPCEAEDRANPKRKGATIKGCTPSLFVTVSWAK